jgi:hypothetical protein
MGRGGRRHKQLLYHLKEKRRYWNLKEEALDRSLWRTGFERGYGPAEGLSGDSKECYFEVYSQI